MNVVRRFHRRPDRWSSPHERARNDAALRLDQQLSPTEAEWLDHHLAACPGCAAVADDYETQRAELRALRDRTPEPPRDLWARTAAAIERESRAAPRRRPLVGRPVPVGVLSGLLVVIVVVGVSMMPRGMSPIIVVTPSGSTAPQTTEPFGSLAPEPTPFAVPAGDVAWLRRSDNGGYGYYTAKVDEVCPGKSREGCAPLAEDEQKVIGSLSAPSTVVRSPNNDQLVVVDTADGGEAGNVYVVPLQSDTSASPSPSVPATPPPASPSPSPTVSPTPSASATVGPSETPSESPSPTPSATVTPAPDGSVTIARDVVLVGDAAGYSADGTWFAFSARPADAAQGSDVYLWKVGTDAATAVTDDHASVFSSWHGNVLLGSRALVPAASVASPSASTESAEPSAAEVSAEAFALEPVTGRRATIDAASIWRPIVDADARSVVYWEGTVRLDPSTGSWGPANGRLVVAAWRTPGVLDDLATPPASAAPELESPTASPTESPSASPAASPASAISGEPQLIQAGPLSDFDARWDPSGTHLAIWIGEPSDASIGRLHLFAVELDGRVIHPDRPLTEVPALPGFSIQNGRLAWATPAGQNAQGSRVQVVAWKGDQLGSVETAPGNDPALIIR